MIYQPNGAIPVPIDVSSLWSRGRTLTCWVASSTQEGDRLTTRYRMMDRRRTSGIDASPNTPQLVLDSDRRGRVRSMTEKSYHFQPNNPSLTDNIVNYVPVSAPPPAILPACTGVRDTDVDLYLSDRHSEPPIAHAKVGMNARLRRAVIEVDDAIQLIGGSVADLRDGLAELNRASDLGTTAPERIADAVAITRRLGFMSRYARLIDLPVVIARHGEAVYNLAVGIERGDGMLFPCFEALWHAHTVCTVQGDAVGEPPARFRPVRLEGSPDVQTYQSVAENIIRTSFELHFASALTLIATGGNRPLPEYEPYRLALSNLRPVIYQDVTTDTKIIGAVAPVLPPTARRGRSRLVR